MWPKTSMDLTTQSRNSHRFCAPPSFSKIQALSLAKMIFSNLPYTIARPSASELMHD